MAQPTKAVADSPIRNSRRSQGVNCRASVEHEISDIAIPTVHMDRYVELALSFVDEKQWAGIADLNAPENKAISDALDALLAVAEKDARKKSGLRERAYYGPTVKLLNLISLAVFDALGLCADTDVACIFASNADRDPRGDILNLRYRPDYHGLFGSHADLVLAIAEEIYDRMVCWPEISLVGEQKKKNRRSGIAQLKSYVSTGNRYRPDIPTFHGFVVHRGIVQLLQLSASGLWGSSPHDIGDIRVWIALVVLMYQSYKERDQKLAYNAQQTEFGRWDFTDTQALTGGSAGASNEPLVLAPFYAASAPGRVTFASFEVGSGALSTAEAARAFHEDEVRGFWKTSWQQTGRSNERDLLDRLHTGGWLPGLVRPYNDTTGERLVVPTNTDIIRRAQAEAEECDEVEYELGGADGKAPPADDDVDPAVEAMICSEESGASSGFSSRGTLGTGEDTEDMSDAEVDSTEDVDEPAAFSPGSLPSFVERRQEILHLASIGEPLSQCSTPRELLHVIYDLLEVHIHMWDEGVLHRDVSWFNALCKPKHHISGDVKSRPCIKQILHCLGDESPSETSPDVDLSPTALLTDLDHAIATDAEPLTTATNGRERTGTPMFISCELSNFAALAYDGLTPARWALVERCLTVVDGHDHGKEALRRAFPHDKGEFLAMFNEVRKDEAKRIAVARLSERPAHKPRHDGESIYWVFLWSLARAQPRGAPAEEEGTRLQKLTSFAHCLLEHKVGEETSRLHYLSSLAALQDMLHEDLAAFEDLLVAMASYLAVPWHLYPKVNDDHVHVAFRRMILGFLLSTAPSVLDIALNTEKPRRLIPPKGKRTGERKTAPLFDSLSSVGASGRANILDRLPPLQRKSPMEDEGQDGAVGGGGTPALTRPSSGLSPPTESLASGSSTGSKKRKAVAPAADEPTKRPKTGPSTSSKPRVILSPDERAWKATKYTHAMHHTSRSAHALRLKVWNDRNRWFTLGA